MYLQYMTLKMMKQTLIINPEIPKQVAGGLMSLIKGHLNTWSLDWRVSLIYLLYTWECHVVNLSAAVKPWPTVAFVFRFFTSVAQLNWRRCLVPTLPLFPVSPHLLMGDVQGGQGLSHKPIMPPPRLWRCQTAELNCESTFVSVLLLCSLAN